MKRKVIGFLQFLVEYATFILIHLWFRVEPDIIISSGIVYFVILLLYKHYNAQTNLIWEEFLLLLRAHICFFLISVFIHPIFDITFYLVISNLIISSLLFLFSLIASRLIRLYLRDVFKDNTLIIGTGKTAESLFTIAKQNRFSLMKVVGFISIKNEDYPYTLTEENLKDQSVVTKNVYPFSAITKVIKEKKVTQVIISSSLIDKEYMENILSILKDEVKTIKFIPRAVGLVTFDSTVEDLDGLLLISSTRGVISITGTLMKRLLDIIAGLLGCILLVPVFFVVKAINLKCGDHGPVIFTQQRIGKNGKLFKVYKFRTMIENAEEVLEELMQKDPKIREEYLTNKKLENDPRITKAGKFLRKSSLDELPQLVNVLLGDMSLVGPRPYLPREKEDMKDYYDSIIRCKPGITGMWQTHGRSDVGFEDRLKMDEYYYLNWNIWLDMIILIKTVKAVTAHEGAK